MSQPEPEDVNRTRQHNILIMGSAEVLSAKVRTVTHILDTVETILLQPSEEWSDDADEDDKRRYEGGAVDSAIVTYAAGCERLQKLLNDDSLWVIGDAEKAVRNQIKELNRVTIEMQKTKLKQQEFLNRPCMRIRAKFFRRFDVFYVIAGDTFDLENTIYGTGKTPAEAMDNFDAVFNSTQQELQQKNEPQT